MMLCATAVFAQQWPTQPVRIIVGFPPGGVADAIPRYLQNALGEALGQSIIVENKPGGAGIIAMSAIAQATDNHTVGVMTLQNLIVPATGATLPYDARKDLQGLVLFGKTASVLTVHTSLPINNCAGAHRLREGESRQARVRDERQRHRASTSRPKASSSVPASTSSTCRTRASRRRTPTSSPVVFR